MRIEIQTDKDFTFEFTFFDKNIQDVPVSGTIVVSNPGGTDLVAETAVSIEADGTIKYTLLATNTGAVDENYRIQLEYKVGDVFFRPFYLFDIVQTPIQNTVRDENLFTRVGELRTKQTAFVKETTSIGTTSTLFSTELTELNQDFKGGRVEISISDTITHFAEITLWESDAQRITFTPAYTSAIASGRTIRIRPSYQLEIDEAFNEIVSRDIRSRVGVAARFIDTDVMRNMTIFKALEIICFAKVEEPDDKWDVRAKKFEREYKAEYIKLKEPVDYDEDGQIDQTENADRPNALNKSINR